MKHSEDSWTNITNEYEPWNQLSGTSIREISILHLEIGFHLMYLPRGEGAKLR